MQLKTTKDLVSTTQIQAVLLIAISAALYGCLGFFGTQLLRQNFSIPNMLFWRFLIATLWMAIWTLIRNHKIALTGYNKTKLFKIFIFGAICYSGTSSFYFITSELIGTGLAMVIFFIYPLFVVLMCWLINKQPITKHMTIALISIVIGLMLLEGNRISILNKVGILLGIISALFYAIYIYSNKKLVQNFPSNYLTIFVCLGSAIIFLVIAITTHSFNWPSLYKDWFYIGALGIIATAIPIQLLLEGLRFVQPGKASVLSVLEPVVTLILGIIALHEPVSLVQLLGALLILLSAVCIQFERQH